MNWQPFDTAPKDGSRILLVDYTDPDKDIYLVYWSDDHWAMDSVNAVHPLQEDLVIAKRGTGKYLICRPYKVPDDAKKIMFIFTPTHWAHPLPHPYTE